MTRIVRPALRLTGTLHLGGDKSISHRYALLAAIAEGQTVIHGYAPGADCESTLSCLRTLGVRIDGRRSGTVAVVGQGLHGLRPPAGLLDAGNSGTTLRLLLGVLAGQSFEATLSGDASLRTRPVERVLRPLRGMGANCSSTDGHPPVTMHGGSLRPIEYELPMASAQVKSAILLAGLYADGCTTVVEPLPTRDHTERALRLFGAIVGGQDGSVAVRGGQPLSAVDCSIPGDPSSAAYFAAAAAMLPGSEVELVNVCLNPTRTAFFGTLAEAGASIEIVRENEVGEPSGRVRVMAGELRPLEIRAEQVPGLIDELPVLGAMAARHGSLVVEGASELRVKETDRIANLAAGLRAFGASVEEWDDGFRVSGASALRGAWVDAHGDHRLAMAFAVTALAADAPSRILRADVSASYPGFFEDLESLCDH